MASVEQSTYSSDPVNGREYDPQTVPKLTDWANEPDIRILKEDLENTKQSHSVLVNKVRKWTDLSKVEGSAKPPKIKGRSQVQPKLIRRQAEWRYSALTEPFLGSDKLYDVKPTTFEDKDSAEQNDIVLNWQFRTKLNRVRFIDDYVRSAVDEGSVVVRVGWKRVTKKTEKEVPVWTYYELVHPEHQQVLEEALNLYNENLRAFNETVPEDVKASVEFFNETGQMAVSVQTGTETIEAEDIIYNQPTLDLVDLNNIYIDPTCGNDFDKAYFAICSFETSQAELKKEPDRYKNLEYVNWETATPVVSTDHATNAPDTFNFKDVLRKKVVAYEYWGLYDIHKTGELIPIVATWIGDVLIRMEENPFPDGKPPFVVVPYMPLKRELMGEPDAELLEDNQKVLGAVTRGMIDLLGRSANSQQGFAKGMLDVVNRRRFENGQDYEFNPNFHPQNGHVEHKYPEIPQSAMLMLSLQNQEAESLTGVKAFSGGVSGESYGDVAAGIRGALDAASKREMAILRRLAKGIIEIGNKIIAMNSIFLSEEEVIRVTNEKFVTIKREDLTGNFDLEVDISTAEVDNNKAQDLAFLLQTTGNTMDFNITKMILSEIARLKRMPVLAKMISSFEPQPDPLEQALKEAEIQKAMKEIEKLDSEIELNRAKAQQALNQADKINLDVVEQETGTKHERDLEKQKAQSRGNQNLKVTEALLKPRKLGESNPDVDAAIGFNAISDSINSNNREAANTIPMREIRAKNDPSLNLGSQYFDPSLDPALNLGLNL